MQQFQFMVGLTALFAASSCGATPIEVDPREALEHQSFEYVQLYGVPADQAEPFGANLTLTVNEEGHVSKACVQSYTDERSCRSLDPQFLRDFRYRPFLRDGIAVPVTVHVQAALYPEERRSTRSVPFPETDLSSLRIKLSRSSCFGTCPAYDVSIDGAGNVVWQGGADTMLEGEYRTQIPLKTVQKLIGMFAAADFYSLDDDYTASVTDNPTNYITFAMGGHSKTIADYVGLAVGMPKSVSDLEAAIDTAAGTERWVNGTPATVEILKGEGFDFASKRAREMLALAVDRPTFLRALISAGVPATPDRTGGKGKPTVNLLANAIAYGDREVIAILAEAGAAKDITPSEAGEMLLAAGRNVDPGLIKTVIGLAPSTSFLPAAKVEALKVAIEYSFQMVSPKSRPYFDKRGAVAAMLEAGADPNRLDVNGNTVLEGVFDPERAAQLIAAGANPNQRNKDGKIPLLSNHNDETTLYLMQITKPGIGDPITARELRERAIQFKFTKVLAQLHKQ